MNTMNKMKQEKATESISNRTDQAEDSICEKEDRKFEITQLEERKVKQMKKSEESLHDTQDTIKRNNLQII